MIRLHRGEFRRLSFGLGLFLDDLVHLGFGCGLVLGFF
jgi:hypothetical protein